MAYIVEYRSMKFLDRYTTMGIRLLNLADQNTAVHNCPMHKLDL